ncbi:MAG: N-acetyltransferase family protein [Treponema sp.]
MIYIRIAEHTDAERLAFIAEKTFRETFVPFNTRVDMDEHCKKSYGMKIQQREIANTDKCTLLCESDNQIIGYAQINWDKTFDGIYDGPQAEIQRIYIEKDWHGTGAAQELMRAILDMVRQHKIQHVWLGVWEQNPRAMAFYKKFGFMEAGEHVFLLGSDPQRDIILYKILEV